MVGQSINFYFEMPKLLFEKISYIELNENHEKHFV